MLYAHRMQSKTIFMLICVVPPISNPKRLERILAILILDRILAMNILPLPQPSLGIAGQVDSLGTKLVLARRPKGFLNLNLIDNASMSVNYDETDEQGRTMIRYALEWANEQPDSINLIPVNRSGVITDFLNGIRRPKLPASLRQEIPGDNELTLVDILVEVIDYAKSIETMMLDAKQIHPSSKKFDLLVLPYFRNDFAEPRVRELLLDLTEVSRNVRLNVLLFGSVSDLLPVSVINSLSWSAFVGPKSESFARDLFQINMESPSLTRARIGIAYDSSMTSEFQSLHGLSYKATPAESLRKANLREEVENYNRFLESLTDGTNKEAR